jgi:hypothetical protein
MWWKVIWRYKCEGNLEENINRAFLELWLWCAMECDGMMCFQKFPEQFCNPNCIGIHVSVMVYCNNLLYLCSISKFYFCDWAVVSFCWIHQFWGGDGIQDLIQIWVYVWNTQKMWWRFVKVMKLRTPQISVKKWISNIQGKRWWLIDIPYECVQIMCEERKFDTYQMIMLMILVLSFKVQIPHSTDHNCSNIHWDVMWNLQMAEVTSSLVLVLVLHYWFQGRTTNPVDWSRGPQLQHKSPNEIISRPFWIFSPALTYWQLWGDFKSGKVLWWTLLLYIMLAWLFFFVT